MPMRAAETILLAMAEAPEGRDADVQRVLGGTGLVVAVALLLAVPLVIAVRSAARRRRGERPAQPRRAGVDAWSESARRLGGDA